MKSDAVRRALLVGAVVMLGACGSSSSSSATTERPTRSTRVPPRTTVDSSLAEWDATCPGKQVEVLYTTGGTAGQVSITMRTPSGTSQASDVDNPISRKSDGGLGLRFCMDRGDFAYISAQNSGSTGTVECHIAVDGRTVASNASQGGYAIASCDARA